MTLGSRNGNITSSRLIRTDGSFLPGPGTYNDGLQINESGKY